MHYKLKPKPVKKPAAKPAAKKPGLLLILQRIKSLLNNIQYEVPVALSNKRKTIALQIKQGDLVVRAPAYLTKQQVEQFVLSKQAWVTKN